VRQQAGDKLQMYDRLLAEEQVDDEAVAFMGDDLLDLRVLGRVGLSAAPADAAPDVRARVDWVSRHAGGDGAARELVETILRAQGRWDDLLRDYVGGGAG
jgi:3-deoxy-D-manno-octulosonate 8-phosphate phosphatase (KDO 8-P phosphatase)